MLAFTKSRMIAFIGVGLVIIFCYLPYIFIYLPVIRPNHPTLSPTLFILISLGTILIFWTYFHSVFQDPGFSTHAEEMMLSPFEVTEIKEESQKTKQQIIQKKSKLQQLKSANPVDRFSEEKNIETELNSLYLSQLRKYTFCFFCNGLKPLRCHHCKTCQRCVMRMDHHCPWTGNCVGQDNQKFFVQFLFYASLTLLTHFPSELIVFYCQNGNVGNADQIFTALIVFNGIFGMVIGGAVFYLFVYQVRNILANLTTVEDNIEGARELKPFYVGVKNNFYTVFGKNCTFWDVVFPTKIDNSGKI